MCNPTNHTGTEEGHIVFFFEAKNITQHFAAMLKDRVPDMEDPREVVDFMGISGGTCSINWHVMVMFIQKKYWDHWDFKGLGDLMMGLQRAKNS